MYIEHRVNSIVNYILKVKYMYMHIIQQYNSVNDAAYIIQSMYMSDEKQSRRLLLTVCTEDVIEKGPILLSNR